MRIGDALKRGAVLSLLVLSVVAASANATAPKWLVGQTIEQNQDSVNGLSCPSATSCFAATDGAVVVQDSGLSYERSPDLSTLNAVSCAPATRFCMFVDGDGGAFTYNNGTLGSPGPVGSSIELDGVSCPSSGFCMAIDGQLNTVFEYTAGSWDGGHLLPIGTDTASNFVNVSCTSTQFCMALVGTDAGELYYTWNGTSWSSASTPFDASANGHVVSLTCTSASFCLETDAIGQALVFNGVTWSSPVVVDNYNAEPVLYSACAGTPTNCVAVDEFDNSYQSSDGVTWTSAVNLKPSTGLSGVSSLTCATATLCVAGDGLGDTSTYAVPPGSGKPALSGTPTVGHALTLTHAAVATSPVWYADDWRRCSGPDSGCSLSPISKSSTTYTLATADTGKYIEVRETYGFGFDEETVRSNNVGPVTQPPGTAKLAGTVTATRTGVVTIPLHCTGGPCKGTVKLIYNGTAIGSASYSIAAGVTAKVKITLNTTGKNQFKQHNWRLPVKLVITPVKGTVTTVAITLKA
jgi:hypothetical protein